VFNALTTFEVLNVRKPKKNVKTRNVVLKIENYKKLEQYKVDLMKERGGDASVTFDDAIVALLDEHYSKKNSVLKHTEEHL
jgi:hypothetical protein